MKSLMRNPLHGIIYLSIFLIPFLVWFLYSYITSDTKQNIFSLFFTAAPDFFSLQNDNPDAAIQLNLTFAEQIVLFVVAFFIKPLYLLLSFFIIWLLRSDTASDLTAIRNASISFFIGENACALNYIFFNDDSVFLEFAHMYGMILCFVFFLYGLMEFLNVRIVHYTIREKRCALLHLCEKCYKHSDVSCTLREIYKFMIPGSALLALIPLTADVLHQSFTGSVFQYPVPFGHHALYQFVEFRILPYLSIILFLISFIIIIYKKEPGFQLSQIFYAAALGTVFFSLMRFFCYRGYQDRPLWGDVWEELTELLFMAAIVWILLLRKKIIKRN